MIPLKPLIYWLPLCGACLRSLSNCSRPHKLRMRQLCELKFCLLISLFGTAKPKRTYGPLCPFLDRKILNQKETGILFAKISLIEAQQTLSTCLAFFFKFHKLTFSRPATLIFIERLSICCNLLLAIPGSILPAYPRIKSNPALNFAGRSTLGLSTEPLFTIGANSNVNTKSPAAKSRHCLSSHGL